MQKPILVSCLLVVALTGSGFGDEGSPRITGGTRAVPSQFMAAVILETPFIAQNCVATVLNRQHVLTAASCVMNPTTFAMINPVWLRIIGGDVYIVPVSVRRVVRNVMRSYVHPNYNRLTDNNNIAVLRVSEMFPEFHNTLEPALLNTRLLSDNTPCRFAGWGATENQTTAAVRASQYWITQPILPTASCNAANVHNNRVQSTMICAGSLAASENSACLGNMGGGLYCNGELSGVLAFGLGCGAANQPSVYIDVRQYAQWIQSQFTRTDDPPAGWVPPEPL
ncbi:trypsin-like [Anopheles bellator]|uniref:trypsin-like n=1 Tax=Anopheles bellator TaxID=139047 RepID=UPI0026493B6E|nr:trypsin-like [Anopheles bellator]